MTREDRERLRELLEDEIAPLLDELVELCRQDPYLDAYVAGNLWADRYGYVGQGVLDIVQDYLDSEIEEYTEEG